MLQDDALVETICCTSKYRMLFGLPGSLPPALENATALGPWYANVLNVGSARLLHYMSSTSLLSVIIWQRERKTAEQRFARSLKELLSRLEVPSNFIDAELSSLASFGYARATNRSVLASMRDQAKDARYHLDETITPLDLSLRLAETPCGPRNYESPKTLAPRLIAVRWFSRRLGA
jgi:hypothetical protein